MPELYWIIYENGSGEKQKAQQRRRSKIEFEQFCYLLAKQIANAFGVLPAIIMFPEYEGQKIKSVI